MLHDIGSEVVTSNAAFVDAIPVYGVGRRTEYFLDENRFNDGWEIHDIHQHLPIFVSEVRIRSFIFWETSHEPVVRLQHPDWPQPPLRKVLHGQTYLSDNCFDVKSFRVKSLLS